MRFILFFSLALSVSSLGVLPGIAIADDKDFSNLELEVKQNGKIPIYLKTGEDDNDPPQGTFVLQEDKTLLPGNTLHLIGADLAIGLHSALQIKENLPGLKGLASANPEDFLRTLREINKMVGEEPSGVKDKTGKNLLIPKLIKISSKENPDPDQDYYINPVDLTGTNIKLDNDSLNILKVSIVKNLSLNLFDNLGLSVDPGRKNLMEPLRDDLVGCDSCMLKDFNAILKLSLQMIEIVNLTNEKIKSIGETQKREIENLEFHNEETAKMEKAMAKKNSQMAEKQSLCILETFMGACQSNQKNQAMLKKIKQISAGMGHENTCYTPQELAALRKENEDEKRKKAAEEAAKNPKPVIVADTTAQAIPTTQLQQSPGPYQYVPPYYPPTTQNNHQNDMAMPMMMMMMMGGGGLGGGQSFGNMGSFGMMPFPFMNYGFGGGGGIFY